MANLVWIVEACDKVVPGRIMEAHSTRASASASARDLRRDFKGTIDYCDVYKLAMSPRPTDAK